MDIKRGFMGVFIPRIIWEDTSLNWTEKLFLAEIQSFDTNGECFASNEYFANFFSLSKSRVSKIVSSLKDKGFVDVVLIYKEGTKEVAKRIIKPLYATKYQLNDIEVVIKSKTIQKSIKVYLVHNKTFNLLKIGITTNIKRRLKELTSASGCDVQMLSYFNGNQSDEKQLHIKFDKSRMKGEWFVYDSEIIENFNLFKKDKNGTTK